MPARLIASIALLVCGLLRAEPPAASRIDLNERWREIYPAALRWDSATQPPYLWHQPESPAALQEWVVRLPAGSWLRVVGATQPCAQDIEVLQGNGSGLYGAATRQCSHDGESALFAPLPGERERVLRIQASQPLASPLRLFASRVESAAHPAGRHQPLELSTPATRVSRSNGQQLRFHPVGPTTPARGRIKGPARLSIRSQLYDPAESGHAACAGEPITTNPPATVDTYQLHLEFDAAASADQGGCSGSSCPTGPSRWTETLDLSTTPEYAHPVSVNGCIAATSQLTARHLDVPPGQFQLQIRSSRPALVRVEQLDEQAYLLSGLNGPRPGLTEMRMAQAQPLPGTGPDEMTRRIATAEQLRRNNARREGGLAALAWLAPAAAERLSAHPAAELAEELLGRQGFWRDLAPVAPDAGAEQELVRVLLADAMPLPQPHHTMSLSATQFDALDAASDPVLLSGLPGCMPDRSTCGPAQSLHYRLPDRQAPSQLQLLAHAPELRAPLALWLQYDEAPAQPIVLYSSTQSAAWASVPARPSLAAALLLTENADPLAARGRLLVGQPELPWRTVADLRLDLPAATQGIRIWSTDPRAASLQLGLRYRVPKAARLTTDDYQDALRQVSPARILDQLARLLSPHRLEDDAVYVVVADHARRDLATATLQRLQDDGQTGRMQVNQHPDGSVRYAIEAGPFNDRAQARAWWQTSSLEAPRTFQLRPAGLAQRVERLAQESPAAGELAQHWLPELRLLEDRLQRFLAPIAPPPAAETIHASAAALLRQARHDLADRNYAAVARTLPLNARWPDDSQTIAAHTLRDTALRAAGEAHLADLQLRALSQHAGAPVVQDWATTELLRRYQDEGSETPRIGLLTARLLADPARRAQWAAQLSAELIQQGHEHAGLWLGLLVPAAEQPTEALLLACLSQRQWGLFARLIDRLDPTEQARWSGYQHLLQGEEAAALALWRQHGQVRLAEHLQRGLALRAQLQQQDPAARVQAALDWHAWQRATPGPWAWQAQPQWVAGHAGMLQSSLHSRDLLLRGYTATTRNPLRLQVQGPALLRLRMRPVHVDAGTELDGWIRIRHNGVEKVLPVRQDRASAGFNPVVPAALELGGTVDSVMELPQGWHQLDISADEFPLLAEVEGFAPRLFMPVLPVAGPNSIQQALQADWRGRLPQHASAQEQALLPVLHLANCQARPLMLPVSSRTGTDAMPLPPRPGCAAHGPAPSWAWPMQTRDFWNSPVPVSASELAGPTPGEPREQLLRAAWRADQVPGVLSAQLEAATLALQHPALAEASGIMRHILERTSWQPLLAGPESWPIMRQTGPGWQPLSTGQQIRQAMLPAVPSDAHVLQPLERLNLHYRRLQPDRLQLQLRLHDLPGLAGAPARVVLRHDHGKQRTLTLTPAHPELSLDLPLLPGDQTVSLEWIEGYANQYLSIRLAAASGPLPAESSREYLLSERAAPLQIPLNGPALVAIRELDGARVRTEYRYITTPQATLHLAPPAGRRQVLYRVSSLQLDAKAGRPAPIRRSGLTLSGLATTALPADAAPTTLVLKDVLHLEDQDAGTMSMALSWHQRAQDDDSELASGSRRFLEVAAIHRKAYDDRHWVLRSEARLRRHADASLSQGLRLALDHASAWSPWRQTLELGLDHHRLQSSYLGASLGLSTARIWAWPPDWNARLDMQLQQRFSPDVDASISDRLDAAVGSRYASNHARRLALEGSLTYTPWLDARVRLQGRLQSNDPVHDTGLDNWRLGLDWAQLLGHWDLSLSGRWQEYLADQHRSRTSQRRQLAASLGYDRWHTLEQRWNLRLEAALEPDLDSYSLGFKLEYSFANGRLYRDFRSSELRFARLRDWHSRGELENNQITEIHDVR